MDRRLSDVVAAAALLLALLIVACDRESRPTTVAPATRFPAAQRIVAFGDVHGDLAATLSALRLAGAIDESSHWIGSKLVVVQTGDQLDRGDQERAILDLFQRLALEAQNAGGAFHALKARSSGRGV